VNGKATSISAYQAYLGHQATVNLRTHIIFVFPFNFFETLLHFFQSFFNLYFIEIF